MEPVLTPETARPGFATIRDLALRGVAALRPHQGDNAPFEEFYLDIPAPPFTCTIDTTGRAACYVDIPNEAAARRFFRDTVRLVESLTPGWEKESDSNEMFLERHRYSREAATISVALRANGEWSVVWVFFSSAE
jgi:hypothetical protein